ncbi:MAG TPA: cache domain-containing protein [Noviherbaspirillum sp.]
MKNLHKQFGATLLCLCATMLAPLAWAGERGSAEEAIAMVKKAVASIEKNGREKAFAEFNDPKNADFHDRDLYIFVYDMNGVNVSHGVNPKLIGKNLLDMKDTDGKPIIRGFIDAAKAKGKGWYDYKWPNPVTKAIEQKSAYIEQSGDLIVGSGIYK